MKAVVLEDVENGEVEFPVLVKSKQFGHIVFFTSPTSGMVIVPSAKKKAGYYDANWREVTSKETWEILPPTTKVELSN